MVVRRRAAFNLLRFSLNHRSDRVFRHGFGPCARHFSSGSVFKFGGESKQLLAHLHGNWWNDCTSLLRSALDTRLGKNCSLQLRYYGSASTLIQRNPTFSELNSEDVDFFKSLLGDNNVIQDEDRLQTANTDWMHKYEGSSKLLLLPRSTNEVSEILKHCNSRRLAVVPQGGNTGLVGGSVPVFDEDVHDTLLVLSVESLYIKRNQMRLAVWHASGMLKLTGFWKDNHVQLRVIINMGLMNKVISFDEVSGIVVCEAGCILENLESFLESKGFVMPLDLGAKGSCQIGGNVSTNAGGLRLVRYGSLHGNVLGLEAVLPDGTVVDMLGTLRKDNTGYDLKHLFIGSEGSLGIVTKVSLLTPPKLSAVNVAFLACNDYLSCQKLLLAAKRKLGEILSAFEFLDGQSMDLAMGHLEGVRNPLPPTLHNFYVLIETTGSNESNDREKLEAFLFSTMESGLLSDGAIAQDMNQVSSFWRIREGIPEALMKAGPVYKYDVSLPVEKMYELVEEMRKRLHKHGDSTRVVGYGHMGDGNLHLNISASRYDDNILAEIEPFVYEWTSKHRGSISAEHGLGLMKANKIHYSKSPEAVKLMQSVKKLLDPNGILNPYKVLPHSPAPDRASDP